MDEADDDGPGARRLCAACIGEPFLKKLVRQDGKVAPCGFCSRAKGRTFSLEEMSDCVEVAFRDHYIRTSDQPDEMEFLALRHGGRDWNRHGDPVVEAIQMAAMIDELPAMSIAEILAERNDTSVPGDPEEEQEFDPDSYYERLEVTEDDHFHEDWARFERSLKSEARFFSRTAEAVLSDIWLPRPWPTIWPTIRFSTWMESSSHPSRAVQRGPTLSFSIRPHGRLCSICPKARRSGPIATLATIPRTPTTPPRFGLSSKRRLPRRPRSILPPRIPLAALPASWQKAGSTKTLTPDRSA